MTSPEARPARETTKPFRTLVLHNYWRSSSSFRVRIALAHKGLDYTYAPVNLLEGAQSAAPYREKSPMAFVPCLEVDGEPFVESVAIIELLDELAPEPRLFPVEAKERARVRALVEIVNAGTQPFQNLSTLKRVSDDATERSRFASEFIARGLSAFESAMAQNEGRGIRGPYAFGAAFGAADCFLVPQVYAANRFGVDLSPYPRIVAANAAALATPAVMAAHPERQPDAKAS